MPLNSINELAEASIGATVPNLEHVWPEIQRRLEQDCCQASMDAFKCSLGAVLSGASTTFPACELTSGQLFALCSDAFCVTEDGCLVLDDVCGGLQPSIQLDDRYASATSLEQLISKGAPSLKGCKTLVVEGDVTFCRNVVVKGDVTIRNLSEERRMVPPGSYENMVLDLTVVQVRAPTKDSFWSAYQTKMERDGCSATEIGAFKQHFEVLKFGVSLTLPESMLEPVDSLPRLETLNIHPNADLLAKTVFLKLNGGLGTSMGFDKAKALLTVKQGNSFLDLIARQVDSRQRNFKTNVHFMFMNSFATSTDTLEALMKHTDLGSDWWAELLQSKAPKVNASDLTPASCRSEPAHEWVAPGHGDLYTALAGTGTLDKLIKKGIRYMFVSNADNLASSIDLDILTHFATSGSPFMMEVVDRTEADRRGGHLARCKSSGRLVLRESAQCSVQEESAFQDIARHKYFNTNNLWIDLHALQALLEENHGAMQLPVIKKKKAVDPHDRSSAKVLQLESAAGSAIECFPEATALVVPRQRFSSVKTSSDLLVLRSDAYILTDDNCIILHPDCEGAPPDVRLDGRYRSADAMERLIPKGAPSLRQCKKLVVEGFVRFCRGVVIKGSVTIRNASKERRMVAPGTYENLVLDLTVVECKAPLEACQPTEVLSSGPQEVGMVQVAEMMQAEPQPESAAATVAEGEGEGTAERKKRRKRHGMGQSIFESQPVATTADSGHTKPWVEVECPSQVQSTFESTPKSSTADIVAGKSLQQVPVDPSESSIFESTPTHSIADSGHQASCLLTKAASSAEVQSTFESTPAQTTADASADTAAHAEMTDLATPRCCHGIFESQPSEPVATVTHADIPEKETPDLQDRSVFESQPLKSVASVKHGELWKLAESDQGVFESVPIASKAHAKAGVDAVNSDSEYETDDEYETDEYVTDTEEDSMYDDSS